MELTVWPPRWDAASMDADCLAALAYIRFSGAPVQVRVHQPSLTAAPSCLSELPRLRHGANMVSGGANIERLFAYLRKENYGVEYDFSEEQLVRMTALMRDARCRLAPAVAQLWWLESRVYTRLTRPAFAEAVGLPVSLAYPVYRHQRTRRRLLAGFGYDLARMSDEALLKQITTDGIACLRRLSTALGQSAFFVADASPCCLDALIFGQLWPLLRAPLSPASLGGGGSSGSESPALLRELRRHQNLVDFCRRLQRAYFPELAASTGGAGGDSSAVVGDNTDGQSRGGGDSGGLLDGAALRNGGLFLAVSGLVFGVYAWQSGWVVVQP